MKSYVETRTLEIRDSYDVIVVGAGIGGVAAAVAAKRYGARVLLIEKTVTLGGQATTGLIHHYLPLCDGESHQVIGGIAEELLKLSIRYGYDTLPAEWATGEGSTEGRYATRFSATAFMVSLDELIVDLGIDLLLDTLGCRPILEGKICTGVVVEDKAGGGVYLCKTIVDGTGDADMFRSAGIMCHRGTNRLTSWAHTLTPETVAEAEKSGNIADAIKTRFLGAALQLDGSFIIRDGMSDEYVLDSPRDVTRFMLDTRMLYRELFYKKQGRDSAMVTMFPAMPLFRTTYRIPGIYTLTSGDVTASFDDSIGCASDWRRPGPVYEIPYRSLICEDAVNMLACGRCMASEGDAWEVTRVIPVAALTGQAAGTAAAMAALACMSPAELDVAPLQSSLRRAGVFIKREECLPSG